MTEPTNPDWPMNVMVFHQGDSVEDIKAKIKTTRDGFKQYNGNKYTYTSANHFTTKHYALLFEGGDKPYQDCPFEVGYYVQMAGLGKAPTDVQFTGTNGGPSGPFVQALNKDLPQTEGGTIAGPDVGLCLDSFWRSAENFHAENCQWAVSQAAPLRNVVIDNNLTFGDGPAYSSGGFLANAKAHNVNFAANQQWFSRSVEFGNGGSGGGAWNTCFSGCTGNVPQAGLVYSNGNPTNLARTVEEDPEVRIEKPFITMKKKETGDEVDHYELVVPPVTKGENAIGPMTDGSFDEECIRCFSNVKVCKPVLPMTYDETGKQAYGEINDYTYNVLNDDDHNITKELQDALDAGKDLVLCPGIFFLTQTLVVRKQDQVILGLGLATLVAPQDGTPCIQVERGTPGVRIAGLVLEASLQTTPKNANAKRCLLEVGEETSNTADPGNPENPVLLADIFCRVGGSNLVREKVETDIMIRIHSGNVVGDNLWLWRADHVRLRPGEEPNDPRFPYYHQTRVWEEFTNEDGVLCKERINECYVENALEVNGDDVKMYGLFCEHTLQNQLVWNGDRGTVCFFQCELPYDVDGEFAALQYCGYYVDPNVTSHKGLGLGVYCNFTQYPVQAPYGFNIQGALGFDIENPFTVFLSGKAGSNIKRVIKVGNECFGGEANTGGEAVRAPNFTQYDK